MLQRILKKIVWFLPVIFMVNAPVSGNTILSLGSVNVVGDSLDILLPLYMTNDGDVAGFEFSIKDDAAAVKIDSVIPDGRAYDFTALHRNNKIILFNLAGEPVQSGDGKIADLKVNVNLEKISGIDTVRFTSQTLLADRTGERIEKVKTVPGFLNYNLISGIDEQNGLLTANYALEQNYPNPFNNSTMIRFAVVDKGKAVIKMYNILGEEIETVFNGTVNPGWHTIHIRADHLASGLYIYKIDVNGFRAVRKLLLMK
ncbi:T9SS type A sorting domain-containing protein [candidate division KSB1 bacterium]|nr:T9SS type A sorting domain-containing protein [candidate division KSB1 bacterium]